MKLERVTGPQQIAAVAELARDIWTAYYTPLIGAAQVGYMLAAFQSEEAITRQISAADHEYYLAPGVGYLALVPEPAQQRMLVSKIYVKDDRRRTGIGRAMIALAEERCRATGCRELWLTVNRHNTASIAFYEKMGFHKTNEQVTDIGGGFVMDDWRMAKTIPPARANPTE